MTRLRVGMAVIGLSLLLLAGGIGACVRGSGGTNEVTRCSDYRTWAEAQHAYEQGARQLDGDSDGIPCESLL